jgi:hypothetical protein
MAYQIVPTSCVELSISIYGNRYRADLQVDGVRRDQFEFQAGCQLAEWASAILCTTGGNLYVRVQPFEESHWQMVLQLVGELSLDGVTISISGQRPVCRSRNRRLQ